MIFRKKKILLIEDDLAVVRILETKLEIEGYEVLSAYNGKTGLEKVMKEKPNLILLDILLPKMNGFEVLRKIKENSETSSIPVMILSNLGEDENINRGIKLGAKDYIVKAHYNLEEIVRKIRQILSHPV